MPRIIKQVQAEQDLLEVWLYTFNEWGERQADAYLDDLSEAMKLLAEQPLTRRERLEFTPPVRLHHHAHHLIVYLALDDGINVVRVLHESMDTDGQLEWPESGHIHRIRYPCGQKTHLHKEINSSAKLTPVSMPFCITSDIA